MTMMMPGVRGKGDPLKQVYEVKGDHGSRLGSSSCSERKRKPCMAIEWLPKERGDIEVRRLLRFVGKFQHQTRRVCEASGLSLSLHLAVQLRRITRCRYP